MPGRGPRGGAGGLSGRPFAGAGPGGRGGPAKSAGRDSASGVSPTGAQCPRPLPGAQRALRAPWPAQQPRSSVSALPLSCFTSSLLFGTPRPASRLPPINPGRRPGWCLHHARTKYTPEETLQTPRQQTQPVHTTRARATGRGRRDPPNPPEPEDEGSGGCGSGCGRGRGVGAGGAPATWEVVARSAEPGCPGPPGWGLGSLQQEDARA